MLFAGGNAGVTIGTNYTLMGRITNEEGALRKQDFGGVKKNRGGDWGNSARFADDFYLTMMGLSKDC